MSEIGGAGIGIHAVQTEYGKNVNVYSYQKMAKAGADCAWQEGAVVTFPPNLFRPGNGLAPPFLAGRDETLKTMRQMTGLLADGSVSASDVLLFGPRGNGKTVLLREWERLLRDAGVDVVRATPESKLSSLQAASQTLRPAQGWRSAWRALLDKGGLSPQSFSLFGVRLDLQEADAPSLAQMLASRCANGPFALLVDEAHMLEAMFARQLLGASQEIRIEGGAFLLVLSGTPGLMQTLEAAQASFWERSQQMPISRLDQGAAAEALSQPLEASGGEADPKALALLTDEAWGYPYFLQAIGSACVVALNERGVQRVDAGVAERALTNFHPIRETFYENRRRELASAGLLSAAVEAARVFADRDSVHKISVENALYQFCGGDAAGEATLRGLLARGLLWPNGMQYEIGIPSLKSHLLQRAPLQK